MPKNPPKITYLKPEPMPVVATITTAVRDTIAAFRAMPALFLATFLIFFAKRLLTEPLSMRFLEENERLAMEYYGFFNSIIVTFLTVPIIVALHRFAILREISSLSSLLSHRTTILIYVIISLIPSILMIMLSISSNLMLDSGAKMILELVISLLCFVGLYWIFRFILALPAIAIEAPNASLSGAARASKGGWWRLFTLLMLSLTIPMCLGHASVYVADRLALSHVGSAAFAVCATIALGVGTMALSHAYIWRSQGPYGRRNTSAHSSRVEPI